MTFSYPAADARLRKARGGPGDPLPAAGLSASAHLWGTDSHHQGKCHP